MKSIAIVIPIYKKTHTIFENISFKQVNRVLKNYDLYCVLPKTLSFRDIDLEINSKNVKRFDDYYFQSVETYSELCLSEELYQGFISYDYILIYQLDAFVFYDNLSEYADMNYDYIGAPLVSYTWEEYHVGNGGLSLRKVDSTLRVVRDFNKIASTRKKEDLFKRYEDLYFGYCGFRNDVDYRVPDIDIAAGFAVQDDSCGAYRRMAEKGLPFGVHRWKEDNYVFWKPIMERYGYCLPDATSIDISLFEKERSERLLDYIPAWFSKQSEKVQQKFLMECGLSSDREFVVWGAGYYGIKCVKYLLGLNKRVSFVIDRDPKKKQDSIFGVNIIPADEIKDIGKVILVVAVMDRYLEIKSIAKHVNGYSPNTITDFFDIWRKTENSIREYISDIPGITEPYEIIVKDLDLVNYDI